MKRGMAGASILIAAAFAGCGGRQGLLPADDDGSAPASASIGSVDLTQAPRQLALSCDQGVGQLAFDNPCQVGANLTGHGGVGFHETECHLSGAGHPVAWSFILPLSTVAANPARPLAFPSDFPIAPPSMDAVEVAGQEASVVGVVGTVSFSRVDPTTRAFSASFKGTISWNGAEKFSCVVDGALWGAPGSFE
jgi:hypothetical protein